MIGVVDQGHVGVFMLLDLSGAFDTVHHFVFIDVMNTRFGVCGNAVVVWQTACATGARFSSGNVKFLKS